MLDFQLTIDFSGVLYKNHVPPKQDISFNDEGNQTSF
jgi:hypothetical protein